MARLGFELPATAVKNVMTIPDIVLTVHGKRAKPKKSLPSITGIPSKSSISQNVGAGVTLLDAVGTTGASISDSVLSRAQRHDSSLGHLVAVELLGVHLEVGCLTVDVL